MLFVWEGSGREDWFGGGVELDDEIKARFRETHLALASGPANEWSHTPENRLAMIVVLDQFPRNIYRGTALAFATDGLALAQAEQAIQVGDDRRVRTEFRIFFYLPYEHAENIAHQNRSVALFTELGDGEYLDYARRHRDLIASYGRFPHRNQALGRTSTDSEARYLAQPGAGF